ncbi:MAG: hypothetical protein ACLUQ6_08770 [Alistipes onderdonkii]
MVQRDGQPERRFGTPRHAEIHGLAWDDVTLAYYVIVTDDAGMWLGRIDDEGVSPVTQGAYITLSNLRAGGGKALLRLDLIGQGRSPLLRSDGPPRIPHHHVGLRSRFPLRRGTMPRTEDGCC